MEKANPWFVYVAIEPPGIPDMSRFLPKQCGSVANVTNIRYAPWSPEFSLWGHSNKQEQISRMTMIPMSEMILNGDEPIQG